MTHKFLQAFVCSSSIIAFAQGRSSRWAPESTQVSSIRHAHQSIDVGGQSFRREGGYVGRSRLGAEQRRRKSYLFRLRGGSNSGPEEKQIDLQTAYDAVEQADVHPQSVDYTHISEPTPETQIQREAHDDITSNNNVYQEQELQYAPIETPTGGEPLSAVALSTGGENMTSAAVVPSSNKTGADEYRKAMLRTCIVLLSVVAFGVGTGVVKGKQSALEFFAGYLVEQSLSVDNLFVFLMLFEYFKVPAEYQGRVLTWGIIGAVTMRAIMIVVGVAAIQRFRGVILVFAGILLASSYKLLTEKEDDHDLKDNAILKISKLFLRSTDQYDGEKFFTKIDGKKLATPLLMCLVCIEISDFVFAVDSIPAVLGVSKDSFIVYTSNVFAIMALRSLYTLVSQAIQDMPYLKPSVALVLGFVGVKMCLEFFHIELGIGLSLSVVAAILGGGALASVLENKRRRAIVNEHSHTQHHQHTTTVAHTSP